MGVTLSLLNLGTSDKGKSSIVKSERFGLIPSVVGFFRIVVGISMQEIMVKYGSTVHQG